jgi:hypothetical protein
MPLQATSGAASYDAFGGGVPVVPVYIEEVFSCFLYNGTGNTQTITNGIDLSTKGGLVWTKSRNAAYDHWLFDTARGVEKKLTTNTTDAQGATSGALEQFNANGYRLGYTGGGYAELNESAKTYTSWTFRKQPKFFDVVTWSGNGSTQTINHNLGSTPGCVIIKQLNAVSLVGWVTYHRSVTNPNDNYLLLNTTDAPASAPAWISPNSTSFTVGNYDDINKNGNTYVAYLFAHDAGGFGLTGTDNVISCGSFTTDGAGAATVNLGYEPQWLMFKASSGSGSWFMYDNMRGFGVTSDSNNYLLANSSGAENNGGSIPLVTSTGFSVTAAASTTYIYIAIRRGPMKVPTSGTSVFNAISRSGTGATVSVTGTGFPPDLLIAKVTNFNGAPAWFDKLRGPNRALTSNTADVEETTTTEISSFDQDGFSAGTSSTFYTNASGGYTYINWQLKRAPSFFDEVCYTGTGSATTFSHNLQAVPELMICKKRNTSASWTVYSAPTGNSAILQLDSTGAVQTSVTNWNNTTPTSSVFSVGTQGSVNSSGGSYVAYLFATCAGVSKVGSYTGTGTLTTINCGFTGGARFVLIKRTDAVEAWYVWDTIRGMVAATDPSLRFNNGGSESNANSVYTIATGFQLLASPAVDVNTNGGSYIFLAIA